MTFVFTFSFASTVSRVMKSVSALVLALTASVTLGLDRWMYGIDYDTRANQWGGCKSANDILLDFKALNSITKHIRLYTTSDGCIDNLLDVAAKENVKLWLGLWCNIEPEKDSFDKEFKTLQRLVKNGQVRNDNVLGIHVASEAMFRYYQNTTWSNRTGINKLIGYLNTTRTYLREHDINIPVTIADVVDTYKAVPELFPAVDVVSINQFSQWEGVHGADGVNVLFDRIKEVYVAARQHGKVLLFSETGWSSAGNVASIKEASPESAARFLHDFMRFTEQQNIAYYYFTSFDLSWGTEGADVVERNFGLFDEHRNLLPQVANTTLGKYHKPVRVWINGQVLKANGYFSDAFGRLYLGPPAVGLSGVLDREIWFWDEDLLTLRSRSTNQCLDTYNDDQGVSRLHVYWCDGTNYNQKWRLKPDGTQQIVSKATAPYADASVDATLGNGTNPLTTDVSVPVGSLFASSRPAHGRCLTAKGTDIAMETCKYTVDQKFTLRPLDTEELYLTAVNTSWRITEDYGKVTVKTTTNDDNADAQIWFYDPLLQRIRNKANGRACLDLVEDKLRGLVQGRWCDHTPSQSWSYNDLTGQVQHLGKIGLCLNVEQEDQELHVVYCDVSSPTQKWTFDLVNRPITDVDTAVHLNALSFF
ncbi:hypothetical protein Ae201684P_010823 [Aphanomyces euteiches]|uniref:glucan endo-1,3-beta-D-glucosidase n=1 Tax=Aphanomyces euteiches TaxID=100861 RepID=A0A6G0WDH4_9STRA|nr:hypothetical protein Ae201684_016899 [Aphanomyces euteiches]KAH9076892.1 hypothetical protein Ae201684P_010823 [Aphanomyces euteiches]